MSEVTEDSTSRNTILLVIILYAVTYVLFTILMIQFVYATISYGNQLLLGLWMGIGQIIFLIVILVASGHMIKQALKDKPTLVKVAFIIMAFGAMISILLFFVPIAFLLLLVDSSKHREKTTRIITLVGLVTSCISNLIFIIQIAYQLPNNYLLFNVTMIITSIWIVMIISYLFFVYRSVGLEITSVKSSSPN